MMIIRFFQLMRRFADIHRTAGARIVLISGDMDFAADIADFKRRMRLSVILLHTNNCSDCLKHAASQHYNFQVGYQSAFLGCFLMKRSTLNHTRTWSSKYQSSSH